VILNNRLEKLKKVLLGNMKKKNGKYGYLNISMIFMELF